MACELTYAGSNPLSTTPASQSRLHMNTELSELIFGKFKQWCVI